MAKPNYMPLIIGGALIGGIILLNRNGGNGGTPPPARLFKVGDYVQMKATPSQKGRIYALGGTPTLYTYFVDWDDPLIPNQEVVEALLEIATGPPPPTWMFVLTPSPATINPGDVVSFTPVITAPTAGSYNIVVHVTNSAGLDVDPGNLSWESYPLIVGQNRLAPAATWQTLTTLPPGAYALSVFVFPPGPTGWGQPAVAFAENLSTLTVSGTPIVNIISSFRTDATPSTVAPGANVFLETNMQVAVAGNYNILLQVFPVGGAVPVFENSLPNTALAVEPYYFSFNWVTPTTLPAGSYETEINIYQGGGFTNNLWSSSGKTGNATITVSGPPPVAIISSVRTTATPSVVALGFSVTFSTNLEFVVAGNYNVLFQVFPIAGATPVFEMSRENQVIPTGTYTFGDVFSVPTTLPTGDYITEINVYQGGGFTNNLWSSSGKTGNATFSVVVAAAQVLQRRHMGLSVGRSWSRR